MSKSIDQLRDYNNKYINTNANSVIKGSQHNQFNNDVLDKLEEFYPLTGGTLDHSELSNLSNDDHTQYTLLNGRSGDILKIDEINEYTIGNGLELNDTMVITSGNSVTSNVPIIVSSTGATDMSYFTTGAIFNYGSESASIYDFKVNTLNNVAIDIDASNNSIQILDGATAKLGFFGSTPSVQSTGWTITNNVNNKTIDTTTATLTDVIEVLGNLITELKNKGLIG